MNKDIANSVIDLLNKKSRGYESYVAFANDLHNFGLSKHASMVLDLIVIGRNLERIKDVLLFTDNKFDSIIMEIHDVLQRFKPKRKIFSLKSLPFQK